MFLWNCGLLCKEKIWDSSTLWRNWTKVQLYNIICSFGTVDCFAKKKLGLVELRGNWTKVQLYNIICSFGTVDCVTTPLGLVELRENWTKVQLYNIICSFGTVDCVTTPLGTLRLNSLFYSKQFLLLLNVFIKYYYKFRI